MVKELYCLIWHGYLALRDRFTSILETTVKQ